MGCEYFPCNDTWDYYINYLNGCKNYEFIDESQIGESQIIRVVTLAEISAIAELHSCFAK